MNYRIIAIFFFVCFISTSLVIAQDKLDNVHLFQSYFRDAPITTTMYGEGGLEYADYEYGNTIVVGAQGGYPINEQIEVGARLGFVTFNPEKGDGESGLTDLTIVGRYNISPKKTNISAGGYITLPIGEEKVMQEKLNFGAFGALRHPLDNGLVITGTLGLDFIETVGFDFKTGKKETEYETSLVVGGGGIYPINDQLCGIGELVLWTEGDYMMLSGGIDYKLQMGSKVRIALGIGLDDGAPDLQLQASFLHGF